MVLSKKDLTPEAVLCDVHERGKIALRGERAELHLGHIQVVAARKQRAHLGLGCGAGVGAQGGLAGATSSSGGSSGGSSNPAGTPAGTYTLTVTAANGGQSRTEQLTLVVQ